MNAARIRKIVSKVFKVDSLRFLGEGDFCTAYLVNREWVFRFAKHAEARRSLQREFCLLPKIIEKITIPIPFPELSSFEEDRSFIAYRHLPDNSLSREVYLRLGETEKMNCAAQVANFLNQFHSLEIDPALACRVEISDYRSRYKDLLAEADRLLFPLLDKPEQDFIAEVAETYLTENNRFQVSLLHGDLSPDHVLFNEETRSVSGIIDFGDMMIGDPVWDLLWIYEDYGLDFLARFLPKFHVRDTRAVLERLFQYSMLEFFDWTLRCRQNAGAEFETCLHELKAMRHEREQRFDELMSAANR